MGMGEDTIHERLTGVRVRIDEACARVGRDPNDVVMVAVSKRFGPEVVREAYDCGLTVLGENRVQEAVQKASLSPGDIEWHLVGHLQRNKVRPAVGLFSMIHSVDSWELLASIDAACGAAGKTMPVTLEVNVSGEGSKFGFTPEKAEDTLRMSSGLVHVDIVGLMTMPPFAPDPEDARVHFRHLRELRDTWQETTGIDLPGLSMGMSHDFEVAIEEGATWIRLGTILFGSRSGR